MKLKKRSLKVIFVIALVVVVCFLFWHGKDVYQFKGNTLHYSQDRGRVDYQKSLRFENDSYEVYNINFQSRNFMEQETRVYALLFMPSSSMDVPGIVYLPGGGMGKEQRSELLSELAREGYAVLVVDQRGIGETGGAYLGPEQDYQVFLKGNEPINHLSVFDVLRAFDVLRDVDGVGEIAVVGESMGGRYGLIAAGIDDRIKGFVGISTAGFHVRPGNVYYTSIDPDHYVSEISPRQLVMIHTFKDSVVPLDDAKITFGLGGEPKKFYLIEDEGCDHGYCGGMWDELNEGLGLVFS